MKKRHALEKIVMLLEDNNSLLQDILEKLSKDEPKIEQTDLLDPMWEQETVSETVEPVADRGADIFNDDWPGGQ